jgi:mRNA interferase HigB
MGKMIYSKKLPKLGICSILLPDMRVVARLTLEEYSKEHAEARDPFNAWYDHVKHAHWHTPTDVQKDFGTDAVLPGNRAVFNIKGKKYRIVVHIHYASQIVFIRFVGTHAEYNNIDATTI